MSETGLSLAELFGKTLDPVRESVGLLGGVLSVVRADLQKAQQAYVPNPNQYGTLKGLDELEELRKVEYQRTLGQTKSENERQNERQKIIEYQYSLRRRQSEYHFRQQELSQAIALAYLKSELVNDLLAARPWG